jgi:transposase-like protein
MAELLGKSFVSRLTTGIKDEVSIFKSQRLEGEYPSLFADMRYEKVRREDRVDTTAVMVAGQLHHSKRRTHER